ncbi:MAG: pilus assembly protein [Acidobacteriota bacterium]|nr:pilus assembly protein [Acidobacteriota bacterium]
MKRERGHAMLELAVSAGVMVSCLVGTFQFGYTFYAYNQLVTAVGDAARYAAQRTYRAATDRDIERGNAAIRNMVVYGDPQAAPGSSPLLPNLKTAHVEVRWELAGDGTPLNVNVSIKGYTMDAIYRSYTFDGRPSVQFPYVGKFAPTESEP